jgi:cytochrome c oxidase subunit 4
VSEPRPPSGLALLLAFVALAGLTGATWALAHAPLGGAHVPVALGIATVKAGVVAAVFMEARHAPMAGRAAAIVCLAFIAMLCAGLAVDVVLR